MRLPLDDANYYLYNISSILCAVLANIAQWAIWPGISAY